MLRDLMNEGFTVEADMPDPDRSGRKPSGHRHRAAPIHAGSELVFDRGGVPVLLRHPADGGPPKAHRLTNNAVVTVAHSYCRPVKVNPEGQRIGVTLPERVAGMYLDLADWGLRPLAGVTCAPLLREDGSIVAGDGYDRSLQVWCANVPPIEIPFGPTRAQAEAALLLLRETFRTFPFQGAAFIDREGLAIVDTGQGARLAELSFLAGLDDGGLQTKPAPRPRPSGDGTGGDRIGRGKGPAGARDLRNCLRVCTFAFHGRA